ELDAALAELSAGLADAPEPPTVEDGETDDRVPALAGASAAGARRDVHSGSVGSGPAAAQVGWRTVNTLPGHLTTYYFSPEDITTAALQPMWSLRTDHVLQVISLTKRRPVRSDGGGPALVS